MGTETWTTKVATRHFVRISAEGRVRVYHGNAVNGNRWTSLRLHSRLQAEQARARIRGPPRGEPQTTPIRKLHVTETLVQKYGPTLGCERCHWTCAVNKSHDAACRLGMTALLCLPFKAQEKSETHDTPVAMDTRAAPASLSTVAADMEKQLPATDKRAAGTIDDSAVEDGHKETKRVRTMRGMEVW